MLIQWRLEGLFRLSFQRCNQAIQVVKLRIQREKISARKTLHHPKMGPTRGKNSVRLAATDGLINTQQGGQMIFRIRPEQSFLPGSTESAGATSSAKALLQ